MVHRLLGNARKELRKIVRAETATHERFRDHLLTIALITLVVELVCSVLAFLLERHTSNTDVGTYGDALFWTSTQLLSVSSSFRNPLSTGGEILDVFMEIYAITVVAALAGAFGSFLQKRGAEKDAAAKAH